MTLMKPILMTTMCLLSAAMSSAQERFPLYFYSKGILTDVIYPSDVNEISFFEASTAAGIQSFQKIVSNRGEWIYPIHAHDSLTFTAPALSSWMHTGKVNILTAASFQKLVYDSTRGQVSPYLREGLPVVVYFWKERHLGQHNILDALAEQYGDRLLFYSVDLEEEHELDNNLSGKDENPQLVFYHNDGRRSTYPGEWQVENLTSFLDAELAGPTPPMALTTSFARGVSKEKGWWDVEKRGVPQDYMACWLITSCNMLQWWQDQYLSAGHQLPESTPNGVGSGPYRLAIMDQAMQSFNDLEKGGSIHTGLLWYIEGKSTDISGQSYPKKGTGGYLSTIQPEYIDYSLRPFITYSDWENAPQTADALSLFSEKIVAAFQRGDVVGMDIKTHVGLGGALHAITIWGADYDDSRQVKGLYITDSDDHQHQLVYCEVKAIEDPFFKTQVIALAVPKNEVYVQGAEWEVLKAYYLSFHPQQ